eukprot:CAMPEP_0115376682 /NCGR_PEP_ID=MMETSP0271-20121206/3101_1 /TAXON_ID=71861 /ORGANISM="Scrippsiella trochoidea, Strain CCMP3099" /LENGTH=172 /DNA_ID=CAMNT_0002799779 /DNA_START=999 /DNA_END=1514 /DNA_ORIENTATION=+
MTLRATTQSERPEKRKTRLPRREVNGSMRPAAARLCMYVAKRGKSFDQRVPAGADPHLSSEPSTRLQPYGAPATMPAPTTEPERATKWFTAMSAPADTPLMECFGKILVAGASPNTKHKREATQTQRTSQPADLISHCEVCSNDGATGWRQGDKPCKLASTSKPKWLERKLL